MHLVLFILAFSVNHVTLCDSVHRLLREMEPIIELIDAVSTIVDDDFIRSIHYSIPGEDFNCISITGDMSLFYECLGVTFYPFLPSVVVSDAHNRLNCNTSLLLVEDYNGLFKAIPTLSFWASFRYYFLIQKGTLEGLSVVLENSTAIFKDAEVIMFVFGDYKKGLQINPPSRDLQIRYIPSSGYWERTDVREIRRSTIRFTTGICDIHSDVTGDGSDISHFSGVDWDLFVLIATMMKTTIEYVPPINDREVGDFSNGTWSGGILGTLTSNDVDVAFCGFWLDWRKLRNFGIQMSRPFQKVCVIYAVPRPAVYKIYRLGFNSFQPSLHALLFVTVFAASITVYLMNKSVTYFVASTNQGFRSLIYCLLTIWGVLTNGNIPKSSQKLGSLRRVIVIWAVFTMLVGCCFSSKLISNFANPPYTKKPDNVETLVKFGYECPYVYRFAWEGVLNRADPYSEQWLKRIEKVPDHHNLLWRLKTKEKQVFVGSMYDKILFIPESIDYLPSDILEKYEVMDECLSKNFIGFALQPGSPFEYNFNRHLTSLIEYGYMKKLTENALAKFSKRNSALKSLSLKSISNRRSKALSIEQLKGIFVVLIIGYIVAFIAYIGEVFIGKLFLKK